MAAVSAAEGTPEHSHYMTHTRVKMIAGQSLENQIQLMTEDFRQIASRVSLEVGNCLAATQISVWFWWGDRYKVRARRPYEY